MPPSPYRLTRRWRRQGILQKAQSEPFKLFFAAIVIFTKIHAGKMNQNPTF